MSESINVNVKEIEMHMWAVVTKWGGSVGTGQSTHSMLDRYFVGHHIGVGYVVVMSPSIKSENRN